MQRWVVTATICAVLGCVTTVAQAEDKGVTVGMLRCNEASGWGLVFGSTRDLSCVFNSSEKGAKPVHLTGKISTYGVDIGYQENAVVLWAVASTSTNFTPGQLAGDYVGATASVAWAVGLGANVLLGGSNKGVALQPISVQGYAGANVAAGVTGVTLALAK